MRLVPRHVWRQQQCRPVSVVYSLSRLWAGWGVDYIKVDDLSEPYHLAEVEMVAARLTGCGRSIVFITSPGETPIGQATNVMTNANLCAFPAISGTTGNRSTTSHARRSLA